MCYKNCIQIKKYENKELIFYFDKLQNKRLVLLLFLKNCAQSFKNYFAIEFNFLDIYDFFLAAVFFTITPFVQAWSTFFVASENNFVASSLFPASTAC